MTEKTEEKMTEKTEEKMTEKMKLKLGVHWKIQDICYKMGTEIFKIE